MAISLARFSPFRSNPTPEPQSQLLLDAITEHLARQDRDQAAANKVLPALVRTILGCEPDFLTHVDWLRNPIAVVDRLIFRGEAEDAYSLKGGWLCVAYESRSGALGWEEVRSRDQLGQLALGRKLKLWKADS